MRPGAIIRRRLVVLSPVFAASLKDFWTRVRPTQLRTRGSRLQVQMMPAMKPCRRMPSSAARTPTRLGIGQNQTSRH